MSEVYTQHISRLEFSPEQSAEAMWVSPHLTTLQALNGYDFALPQPIMVIIGGAGLLDEHIQTVLEPFFNCVLAPLAQELGITVLDGGTDSGVIRMMGNARAVVHGDFRLSGVVPQGQARVSCFEGCATSASTHNLEPNHTHFFLIPGDSWGMESPWLADFATLIAGEKPSLTILMNGGKASLKDLQANLKAGRLAIVVKGSGRLADQVATALAGTHENIEPEILSLLETYGQRGQLRAIDISTPLLELFEQLKQYFENAI
jgi:hypothetical protein